MKGTVIAVTPTEVSVNLGYKSDGIIAKSEITDDPSVDISKLMKPGDVIDVFVIHVNDGEGNVLLSKKKIDAQKNFIEVEEAFSNKTTMPGKITEVVKGGVIANIKGLRAFVPSKQVAERYIEDLNTMKGQTFDFNILEFDRGKKRIVAGRRELAMAEKDRAKNELFDNLEVGQKVEGVVRRITAFGAFVSLGAVDGLVHISELAWSRVKKVTDVVNEGDTVAAVIVAIDKEKGKVSLSLRGVTDDPWKTVIDKYPVGSFVEGKVVRLVPFGAFVQLEDGVDGLIHVSQIASRHVVKPEDELTIGETVRVKVTEINEETKKISLSKKEADIALEREAANEYMEEYADASQEEGLLIEIVQSPETIAEVADLARIIWPEVYTPIIGEAQVEYMLEKFQSVDAVEKQIKEEGVRYYLAVLENRPVGYCAVSFEPETREVFLSKIYVEAEYRDSGVASALIETFVADFEPVRSISLTVNKNNAQALAAYDKLGFTNVGEVLTDIGEGYVMDDYKLVLQIEE